MRRIMTTDKAKSRCLKDCETLFYFFISFQSVFYNLKTYKLKRNRIKPDKKVEEAKDQITNFRKHCTIQSQYTMLTMPT